MTKSESFCFNVDNPKIQEQYRQYHNYKVEYNSNGNQDVCVIYFTSHALYYPNTEQSFIDNVIDSDTYEWYKTRHLSAGMHVFVRDVFKQWYLKGINSELCSIEKLSRFLSDLTIGKNVICIGASAGGYAAMLIGSIIGAKTVIAFNPQINLEYEYKNSTEAENALLHRLISTDARQYYDLNRFLNAKTDIYYVYSSDSEWDINQLKNLNMINSYVNIISVKSDCHGVPIPKPILREFISAPKEKLINFVNADIKPILIMVSFSLRKTLEYYADHYCQIIRNKICR